MSHRTKIIAAIAIIAFVGAGVWWWAASGRESTDDAQVDAHVTPIAARVGGTVLRVPVIDNQEVEAGAVIVEIDPRDYQLALERARAELADAVANADAAKVNIPIISTTTTSNVSSARGGVDTKMRMLQIEGAKTTDEPLLFDALPMSAKKDRRG